MENAHRRCRTAADDLRSSAARAKADIQMTALEIAKTWKMLQRTETDSDGNDI
jgi:hypothetical protein